MRRLLALSVALLWCAGPVFGQAKGPLEAVGTDAAAVLRLKNPKATIDKVADLVDAAKEGFGGQVRTQAGAIGLLISNPTLAGVDMEQDWYVAVYVPQGADKATDEPEVVFVIPATDLKAMKDGLDPELKFQEHGKYGVYTLGSKAANAVQARLNGTGKSIASLADTGAKSLYEKGDISLFLNLPLLRTVYADEVDQFFQQARQSLANLPEPPGGPQGIDPKLIGEVGGQVLKALEDAKGDLTGCTIALNVAKTGILFEDLVGFTPGSAADRFLSRHKPAPFDALAKFPEESLGYGGVSVDFPELATLGTKLMQGNNPANAAAKEAMETIAKIKTGSVMGSFGLGSMTDGIFRMTSLMEVADPTALKTATRKMLQATGNGIEIGNGMKQKYELAIDGETIGGEKADVLKTEMEFDPNDPQAAMAAQAMGMMYGPEGLVTRSVFQKDRMLTTTGGGTEAMEALLTSLKGTARTDSPAGKTRSVLGPQANVLGLMDLPGTVAKALRIVGESDIGKMFLPLDEDTLEQLALPSSYSGLSLAVEPAALRTRTAMPVEQIRGVLTLVEIFQKLQAGMGAGGAVNIQLDN